VRSRPTGRLRRVKAVRANSAARDEWMRNFRGDLSVSSGS